MDHIKIPGNPQAGQIISISSTVDLGTSFAGIGKFLIEADGGAAAWTIDGSTDPGTAWYTLAANVPTIFEIAGQASLKFKGTNLLVTPLV